MNIGNVFKSERQKKLAEWAEAIASRARAREERAQAIAAAEADPDYQVVYVLGVAAKKRLDGLRHQGWDLSLREDGEVNQLEHDIRSLADPRIEQFLTWAYGEKTRAGQQIVARGEVRRGRLGFGEKGFLETNQQKVYEVASRLLHPVDTTKKKMTYDQVYSHLNELGMLPDGWKSSDALRKFIKRFEKNLIKVAQ